MIGLSLESPPFSGTGLGRFWQRFEAKIFKPLFAEARCYSYSSAPAAARASQSR